CMGGRGVFLRYQSLVLVFLFEQGYFCDSLLSIFFPIETELFKMNGGWIIGRLKVGDFSGFLEILFTHMFQIVRASRSWIVQFCQNFIMNLRVRIINDSSIRVVIFQ
ncbi:hypothetical protein ACEF17_13320, partial [Streptococcus hyovaginalis]